MISLRIPYFSIFLLNLFRLFRVHFIVCTQWSLGWPWPSFSGTNWLLSPETLANISLHVIGSDCITNMFQSQLFGPGGWICWLAQANWTCAGVGGGVNSTENIWLRLSGSISLRAKSVNYWWVKGKTTNKWVLLSSPAHLDINHLSYDVIHLSRMLDIICLASKETESCMMVWWLIFLLYTLNS